MPKKSVLSREGEGRGFADTLTRPTVAVSLSSDLALAPYRNAAHLVRGTMAGHSPSPLRLAALAQGDSEAVLRRSSKPRPSPSPGLFPRPARSVKEIIRFTRCLLLLAIVVLVIAGCGSTKPKGYLVILQSGVKSSAGHARMLHALLYSLEMKKAGYELNMMLDVAGTTWVQPLVSWQEAASPLYKELAAAGAVEVICDFCATAFGQRPGIEALGRSVTSEFKRHPSIVKWTEKGYQVITL